MLGKLVAVAAVATAALALAPAAFAHNVSVSPRYGELGSDFVFFGTAWQRYHRVRWFYDEHADGSFQQSSTFRVNRYGRFRFRWSGEDVVDTHRFCFRQFDTRYQRTFFKCRLYTVFVT